MAYSELVKNFNRIRDYMREFYVFGFKSREEYNKKSARSYDNERRRIESWLGDYMCFRQSPDGKKVFLSIDSRITYCNPLYKAWKTKSFTDRDILLHFYLFDILCSPEISMSLNEIADELDDSLSEFENPHTFDESTLRKKLKEYVEEGMISAEKKGKVQYYRRAEQSELPQKALLHFFSEVAPCGVIGSFLLDRTENEEERFIAFKHHYITGSLDSEVLYRLFRAIRKRRAVAVEIFSKTAQEIVLRQVVPLKVLSSVQNGRQYLMAFCEEEQRILSFRLDKIISVVEKGESKYFFEHQKKLEEIQKNIWGVSMKSYDGKCLEHIDFTIRYDRFEKYIHNRLVREKRFGKVEKTGKNMSRFSVDVYDSSELIPWIRTFISRIVEINFSNAETERRFWEDFDTMCKLYGVEGGA